MRLQEDHRKVPYRSIQSIGQGRNSRVCARYCSLINLALTGAHGKEKWDELRGHQRKFADERPLYILVGMLLETGAEKAQDRMSI